MWRHNTGHGHDASHSRDAAHSNAHRLGMPRVMITTIAMEFNDLVATVMTA